MQIYQMGATCDREAEMCDGDDFRIYKAIDFKVSEAGRLVKIEVDSKVYFLDAEQAKQISLEMGFVAATYSSLPGISIHLDGDRYRMRMDQVVNYSFKVYMCAKLITRQGELDD